MAKENTKKTAFFILFFKMEGSPNQSKTMKISSREVSNNKIKVFERINDRHMSLDNK